VEGGRGNSRAKQRARHIDPLLLLLLLLLRKFSGTNLRQGGRDEFLVAAPRRELDQNSTHRAINELVSRHRQMARP